MCVAVIPPNQITIVMRLLLLGLSFLVSGACTLTTIALYGSPVPMLLNAGVVDSVFGKLVDNGMTLTVVGFVAYMLYKRQVKMEDRLNKYQDEDRSEMLNIIQRNTNAFNTYKQSLDENTKVLNRVREDIEATKAEGK